jgi:flagellar FliL protein
MKKILFLALPLAALVSLGGVAYFAPSLLPAPLASHLPWAAAEGKAADKSQEKQLEIGADLEPFAVNLAGPGFSRYLRLSFRLRLKEPEAQQRLREASARIRDALIMLLTSKRAEELMTEEGKEKLRGEILARVNEAVGEQAATAVYFKEFLIQ